MVGGGEFIQHSRVETFAASKTPVVAPKAIIDTIFTSSSDSKIYFRNMGTIELSIKDCEREDRGSLRGVYSNKGPTLIRTVIRY